MLGRVLKWLLDSGLDRALATVDKAVEAQTDRERIKAEILKAHLASRPDYMRAGGFWLMLLFAVPLAVWHAMVIYDSAFGCADCLLANDWTVADLPPRLAEWAGWIVLSIFGVLGADRLTRR